MDSIRRNGRTEKETVRRKTTSLAIWLGDWLIGREGDIGSLRHANYRYAPHKDVSVNDGRNIMTVVP
jgi:hypothetical protein